VKSPASSTDSFASRKATNPDQSPVGQNTRTRPTNSDSKAGN
jgi:hypothetical protein